MKNSNFVFAFTFVLDICFFTYLTERRDWQFNDFSNGQRRTCCRFAKTILILAGTSVFEELFFIKWYRTHHKICNSEALYVRKQKQSMITIFFVHFFVHFFFV